MNRRRLLTSAIGLPLASLLRDGRGAQAQEPAGANRSLRESVGRAGLVIGAAVFPAGLDDERYARVLSHEFNALTPENALKWGPVHPEPKRWNLAPADRLVEFAAVHGMQVKGHALIWHEMLPLYVNELGAEELRRATHDHIRTLVDRYHGKVRRWDVVNEALDERGGLRRTVFLEKLGDGYLAEVFRVAHEADPEAHLIYNDYGCEGLGAKSDGQYRLLRGLKEAGVPIHGVGLQMHIRAAHSPRVEDVAANVARLAALGLRVNISEMDIRLRDLEGSWPERLELQAKTCGSLLNACMQQPAFEGVTFWGFTDAHSWIHRRYGEDRPLLFDRDYAPKPVYFAVREALVSWSKLRP
jgi:endo-1,4-beta-xylanase